ncbi:GNAT family N-acetyltransferase [Tetragenococcus halophilus]|uniref:GNAT family N-acetyltransferase n=1 Tax=Tetragenococcus halophilus TaxID=51669 RepID=UPI000CB1BB58|nr:GNAT family N-acetyltransferase [Tetragenococcus halophilus]RQD29311.1 N-acetyltransferase [Tetragenococcus halophilus subsp. halophilus DSM 20339]GBD58859.1 putative acetyltransferase [Tetragenococcus halophilus subsp. halophilus]GFK22621.1 phosphinothricin N-acetyltransferase [Tetragenococcus halophilus]GMA45512.1 N-acetyltransferase [Tetragenococcus halophilus subsp. halophilus DSM 20339]
MRDDVITIRKATAEDASEILAIYAPYVAETTISFEQQVLEVAEFATRITKTLPDYPYYVAQDNKQNILGYAYADAYNSRVCYNLTAEISIYVKKDVAHRGVGTTLYEVLEEQLKRQHVVNLLSIIAVGNQQSEQFHIKQGFEQVGYFPHVGYKFDRWLDVIWMQKTLQTNLCYPGDFIPFSEF